MVSCLIQTKFVTWFSSAAIAEKQGRRKHLFWLLDPDVSVHGQLTAL